MFFRSFLLFYKKQPGFLAYIIQYVVVDVEDFLPDKGKGAALAHITGDGRVNFFREILVET